MFISLNSNKIQIYLKGEETWAQEGNTSIKYAHPGDVCYLSGSFSIPVFDFVSH